MDPALTQAISAITGAVVMLLVAVTSYIQAKTRTLEPPKRKKKKTEEDDDED